MNLLKRIEWRLYKEIKRLRLKNRDFSILSSNCNGGMIYHDMKLKFLTPTINLSFEMNDFVCFLEDLDRYLQEPLTPFEDARFDYPCGKIGDIEIRFNHYKSFDEAKEKWEERKKRINFDNLFIMAIDGDGCTYETIKRFDKLPFENKVIFTHKPYKEFSSVHYIKGFESEGKVGILSGFKNKYFIRRYLDDFDYISFFNQK